MTDNRVNSEVRRLVFANLVKSVPLPNVMEAFHLSEKEVMDIFDFVAKKVISYRFERAMPYVNCKDIRTAQQNPAIILLTLKRLNLETDPKFKRVDVYPVTDGLEGSEGYRRYLETQMRSQR